ncbi:DUF983 domain-containing protein [Oricola sp.]|uniref:DUF983 domain-containing protein n=1 Tax=Oricola sp. TaxID=1979950 RepID=UPI003BA90D84
MSDTIHFPADETERPVMLSVRRGMSNRCPKCGNGRLFDRFLKPVDNCPTCGEEMHHQRADDLPPYLNVFIVGHVVVGGFTLAEVMTDWSAWLHLAIWAPLTIVLALVLMQPLKGGVIGFQWANRMHGFGGEDDFSALESHGAHD